MVNLTSYKWRILYLELFTSLLIYHHSTRQVFSICYTSTILEKVSCSCSHRQEVRRQDLNSYLGPKSVLLSLTHQAGQKKTSYNKANDLKTHRILEQERILQIVGFNFLILEMERQRLWEAKKLVQGHKAPALERNDHKISKCES